MSKIRTTVSLPEDVHEEWKKEAMRRKITLGDLILMRCGVKQEGKSVGEKIREDFKLFDEVARSGKRIDLVRALREERERDD